VQWRWEIGNLDRAVPLLFSYPITRKKHAQLVEQMAHTQESFATQTASSRSETEAAKPAQ
jgi:Na+/melibiose symporter-like transporter